MAFLEQKRDRFSTAHCFKWAQWFDVLVTLSTYTEMVQTSSAMYCKNQRIENDEWERVCSHKKVCHGIFFREWFSQLINNMSRCYMLGFLCWSYFWITEASLVLNCPGFFAILSSMLTILSRSGFFQYDYMSNSQTLYIYLPCINGLLCCKYECKYFASQNPMDTVKIEINITPHHHQYQPFSLQTVLKWRPHQAKERYFNP